MTKEKTEEAPKRKRRTKEEIENSKTSKSKKVEKVVKEFTPEQSVIVMSCLNSELSKKIYSEASKLGVGIVLLSDSVIKDYISKKSPNEEKAIECFLSDTKNRINATEKAQQLLKILSRDVESEQLYGKTVFTEQEVVNKTNLSHSKAKKILYLLNTFGLIEFVRKDFEFVFKPDEKSQLNYLEEGAVLCCQKMNEAILKYRTCLESMKISREEKNELYKIFISNIKETIIK